MQAGPTPSSHVSLARIVSAIGTGSGGLEKEIGLEYALTETRLGHICLAVESKTRLKKDYGAICLKALPFSFSWAV